MSPALIAKFSEFGAVGAFVILLIGVVAILWKALDTARKEQTVCQEKMHLVIGNVTRAIEENTKAVQDVATASRDRTLAMESISSSERELGRAIGGMRDDVGRLISAQGEHQLSIR